MDAVGLTMVASRVGRVARRDCEVAFDFFQMFKMFRMFKAIKPAESRRFLFDCSIFLIMAIPPGVFFSRVTACAVTARPAQAFSGPGPWVAVARIEISQMFMRDSASGRAGAVLGRLARRNFPFPRGAMNADNRADLVADLASPRWIERAATEFQRLRQWRWAPVARNSRGGERKRRTRARRSAHRLLLRVEADEAIAHVLVAAGFLSALSSDQPEAINAAVERLLERLVVADVDAARGTGDFLKRYGSGA